MSIFNVLKKSKKADPKKDESKKDIAVMDKKVSTSPLEKKEKKPQMENVLDSQTLGTYRTLVRPAVTEKSAHLTDQSKYVFEIYSGMNKIEVAKAIEKIYGVKPVKVNIMRMRGKEVRFGRFIGKRKNWKKAIVALKKGDKIEVYASEK